MTDLINKIKSISISISLAAAASVNFIFPFESHAADCEQIHDDLRICFNVVGDLIIDDWIPDLQDRGAVRVVLNAVKGTGGYFDSNKQFEIYYKYNSYSGGTTRAYVDCMNRVLSYGIRTDQNGALIPSHIDPETGLSLYAPLNQNMDTALVDYFCDGKYITASPQVPSVEPSYSPEPTISMPSPTRPTLRETLSDTPFQWKR